MSQKASIKSVSLFCKEGGADKEYHAQIEEKNGEYVVNAQYGKRGGQLACITKTKIPVSLALAEKEFAKLVKEKTGKGYQPLESRTVMQDYGVDLKLDSGIRPQLLNPITEDEALFYIRSNDWIGQEKVDGHHKMVKKLADQITGMNKKGQVIPLPQAIVDEMARTEINVVVDGENIGDKMHLFDLLEYQNQDWRKNSYGLRLATLEELFEVGTSGVINVVETAWTTEQKQAMFDRLKKENKEGMVFKRHAAVFTAGRPNSGGDMLKCKFWATLSAIVLKRNVKSSIEVGLNDDVTGEVVSVGNVTVSAAEDGLRDGDVVEIRYLYALKSSRQLYQPVFLNPRDDVSGEECMTSQLKFKPEVED